MWYKVGSLVKAESWKMLELKQRKMRLLRAGKMTFTTLCALGSCMTLDNGFFNGTQRGQ